MATIQLDTAACGGSGRDGMRPPEIAAGCVSSPTPEGLMTRRSPGASPSWSEGVEGQRKAGGRHSGRGRASCGSGALDSFPSPERRGRLPGPPARYREGWPRTWPNRGEGVAGCRHRGSRLLRWLAHVDLARGPCDRLPDVQDGFGDVEVTATQPEYLPGPQPTPASQEHRQALPCARPGSRFRSDGVACRR